jgi:hypothetical protein
VPDVAALYIDPRGPYPKLLGTDMCWDAKRDARTYEGPWPIVAHPACGPWGRLRHPPDAFGGYTIEVNQCDWGHCCRKPTWLYLVRVETEIAEWRPEPREPTHWIDGGHDMPPGIKAASAQMRRRTPPLFAEWLVLMASTVVPRA